MLRSVSESEMRRGVRSRHPCGHSREFIFGPLHNLRSRRLRLRKRTDRSAGRPTSGENMGSTPSQTTSTTFAPSEDTAVSLDPGAAPLLRRAVPDIDEMPMSRAQQVLVGVFVFVPMLALLAAIPFAWGWGLSWHDVVIAAVFYWVSGLGVTVGYHRYFTHGSFKAKTGLRVALAIAGSMAMQGPVITWVSDHRRHHKYSDKE